MHKTLLLALLLGCDGEPASPSGDEGDAVPEDTGAEPDTDDTGAAPRDCGLRPEIGADVELGIPGAEPVGLSLLLGGSAEGLSLLWSASAGSVEGDESGARWTLPGDLAAQIDETHTASVLVEAPGCAPEQATLELAVGHPEWNRVLVLSNPEVEGSDTVARTYMEMRGIPEGRHCAVGSEATVVLAGADYEPYLDAVLDCVEAAGPQLRYLVPVFGAPYKVSGRIDDIAGTGAKATVSLDALLALGEVSRTLEGAVYNPLYQDGSSITGEYDPYVPVGGLLDRMHDPMLLVSRIDGASVEAALELVERSAEARDLAEAGLLDGVVCVDGRFGDTPPATDEWGSYESGEWNMWGTRTLFEGLGWYPVQWDGNGAEFGTEPAPLRCDDALYYAGWYSYNNYNDAFTWAPGAIGGHLDSCSACDIRGGAAWAANALQRGITATFGAVGEPYVAGMPEYDQLFLYLSQGASFGEAAYESTVVGAWMMVWVGDPLYRPYPAP